MEMRVSGLGSSFSRSCMPAEVCLDISRERLLDLHPIHQNKAASEKWALPRPEGESTKKYEFTQMAFRPWW